MDIRHTVQSARQLFAGTGGGEIAWLAAMCAMLTALLLPFASYVAALPVITEEWGLSHARAGAVYSAYLAGYSVSALVVIPLTDRLGPKRVFLASAPLSVAAHTLFSLGADGMVSGMLLMALAGVGLVGIYMPGLRIISERFHTGGRGLAMGLYVTAYYAGNSISLASTGALMSALEWREAYLVTALASSAGVLLVYLLLRSHRDRPSGGSSGRLDLSALRNRPVRHFIVGYSLHAWELYAVRVWLPVFLVSVLVARGVDGDQAVVRAATVGGIALTAGAIGPVAGGMISDRLGRAVSAMAIFGLSGALSWAIGWMGGFPWAAIVAVAVIYGWAISADSAIYTTAIAEASKSAQLGSTMAMQAFLGFSGGVVGPVVVGAVLDATSESWVIGFSSIGLISVAAIPVLLRVRSFRPEPSSTSGG